MEIGLHKLIGHRVIVMGPTFLDSQKLGSVKLLAVEDAGIWIESLEAFDKVIGARAKRPSVDNLAFFIPWSQVTTIVAGLEPE